MHVVVSHKNHAVCAINSKHSHVICAVSPTARSHICVGTQQKSLRIRHCMLVQVQAEKTRCLL